MGTQDEHVGIEEARLPVNTDFDDADEIFHQLEVRRADRATEQEIAQRRASRATKDYNAVKDQIFEDDFSARTQKDSILSFFKQDSNLVRNKPLTPDMHKKLYNPIQEIKMRKMKSGEIETTETADVFDILNDDSYMIMEDEEVDGHASEHGDIRKARGMVSPSSGSRSEVANKVIEAWADHHNDWFKAKEDLVFSQAMAPTPDTTKTDKMKLLLALRTEYICREVLEKPVAQCLFDGEMKPMWVVLPAPYNKCEAMAIGSVTMLSDLDFTVDCSRNLQPTDDKVKMLQLEVTAARELTRRVTDGTGVYPGTLFDTNFYTNTLVNGRKLLNRKCGDDPVRQIALAEYAVSRGLSQLIKRMQHLKCPGAPDARYVYTLESDGFRRKSKEFYQGFSESKIMQYVMDLSQRVSGPIYNPGNVSNMYRGLMKAATQQICAKYFQDGNSCMRDIGKSNEMVEFIMYEDNKPRDDEARTALFYDLCELAISDEETYCFNAPIALLFANEAYWLEGAISDIVFGQKTLSPQEGFESIMMNLGYALEHLTHEMHKGDAHPKGSSIYMSNRGDGMIKLGKYMTRVKATAAKTGLTWDSPVIDDLLLKAERMAALKKQGAKAEAEGDALGLPKRYVEAAMDLEDRGGECQLYQDFIVATAQFLIESYAKLSEGVFKSPQLKWTSLGFRA